MGSYVAGAVVAETVSVMHVLLFVLGGTRGSAVLSSAGDVLEMSVVRGVGGVCDMCMTRDGVGGVRGKWVTGLGLGFTNSEGTWGK